jgi:hypothetical protein
MSNLIRIDPITSWYPQSRIMIVWSTISRHKLMSISANNYMTEASLGLCAHANRPRMLCVIKNRYIDIRPHQYMLDQIFDDYTIIDDGWRGGVEISESDWVRHQLSQG